MSLVPVSAAPAATASSRSSCSLASGSAAPSTSKTPHTSTRCLSNAALTQRPPLSRPPKLSLIIPSTSQSASRRLACSVNSVGSVNAAGEGVTARFPTSSTPSGPSPSSADSDPSKSESLPSYSRSYVSSSLPGPPASDSQISYRHSSNICHPPPNTLYKQHTPRPRPLPATVVAHTLLSRHINSSTRSGSPWGALGASCGRKRYVESGLKAEV